MACVLVAALAWLPIPSRAWAGPPDSGTTQGKGGAEKDPAVLELRELYDKAHVAFLAGRYLDAAAAFDAGYAQSQMVAFLYNGAVAWEQAGNLEQAIERYAAYLTKAPDAPDYAEVNARVEQLRTAIREQRTATVDRIAETKGVIILTSSPPGAEVRLDNPQGPVFALTPYQGTLPPGEHIIYVTAPGYKDSKRTFPDNSGKVLIGHFALSEEYFLGQLEVKSPVAGADVFLTQLTDAEGGEVPQSQEAAVSVGKTPFSNQLAPGTWRVRVAKDGYVPFEQVVEVEQGKIRTLEVRLAVESTGRVTFEPTAPASEGAQVFLAGSLLCDIPCSHEFPPGHYEVTIQKAKLKDLFFEMDVQPADRITVDVTMEPKTKRRGAVIAGVLMAATAGTGAFFAVQAKKTEQSIRDDLDLNVQFDTDDPRRRKGLVQAAVADSLFGVTAVLGALTLYYALRKKGPASKGEIRTDSLADHQPILAPVLAPGSVGLAGSVRF